MSRGFTVVELAIVLLIAALVLGAIVTGRSLIRSSELRSVVSESNKHIAAFNQFAAKYRYLPGDFPQAEAIWGSDAACPFTPSNAIPKTATCNGDGDGYIESDFFQYLTGDNIREPFSAWQQLANSGMIEGVYTGVQGPNDPLDAEIGINVPKAKIEGAGYLVYYVGTLSGDFASFDGTYGHTMFFGAAAPDGPTTDATLTPAEAYDIDNKIDDGKPAYGKILTYKSTAAPNCPTTDVSATAAYNVSNANRVCPLIFITGF